MIQKPFKKGVLLLEITVPNIQAPEINSEMWIRIRKGIKNAMQCHAFCASWLGFLGWNHRRAEEAPNVPEQLCRNGDRSVPIRSFTLSLHQLLLLACQKASAGLDGREQS